MTRPMSVALTLTVAAIVAPRAVSVAVAGGPGAVVRPSKQYTIEQFLATTSVSGPSFSPDGSKVLFTSDASGIPNAYTVPFAGRPVDAADPFDHRIDLRPLVLPQGRARALHARPGRRRAQPPLRARPEGGDRPDPGLEAQGHVRRLVAGRLVVLRPDQRARPAVLRRLPLRGRGATSGPVVYEENGGLHGRRRLRRRPLGRADEAEDHGRRRHLPVGQPGQRDDPPDAPQAARAVPRRPSSTPTRSGSTT